MKKDKDIVNLFEEDCGRFVMDDKKKSETIRFLQTKISSITMIPKASFGEILRAQFKFMNKKSILFQLSAFVLVMWVYVKAGNTLTSMDLYLLGTIAGSIFSVFLVISCIEEEKNNMTELAGSCFFNNRQLCILRMILSGGMNLIMLSVIILYTNNLARVSLIQVGVYTIVPYLVSGCIHFLVMLTGRGKNNLISIGISGVLMVLCSSAGIVFPEIYDGTATGIWVVGLFVFSAVYAAEIVAILKQMDRGERLCMN